MQLEHLCDVSWTYDLLHEVKPSEGADGRIYGQGTATFEGRLSGSAQWSNFPRIRNRFALPDARGVIHAGDIEVLSCPVRLVVARRRSRGPRNDVPDRIPYIPLAERHPGRGRGND